ncbi:hypothetical protein V6N12_037630 [Hibiscus sabdariffa]|uniref:Uncharacterized protein n=1 Tax=Hibiscus sabdariffa TaxID=183260 RepID=A0ABR2C193_9ROSI
MTPVEDNLVRYCRSVVGVVNEAKLSVLETCALGWVNEAVSIRVEMMFVVSGGEARESVEKPGVKVGEHRVVSHAVTILGADGVVVALVIRFAQGGAKKVKSVNSLVDALGLPT